MELIELGFNEWFREKIEVDKLHDWKIARIINVHKNAYTIKNETAEVYSEINGKLMFDADSPLNFPTVGDWVYAQYFDNDTFAIIHEIFPRKSILKRKSAGNKIDYQLIATNIDTAFIIQSLDANFNIRRLERYLIMINESNIFPVLLLSKSDMVSASELEQKILAVKSVFPDLNVISFSNINNLGLDRIKELLVPCKTFCLLGSSGVGKTTLLNNLIGSEIFATQEVREKDRRGRHVTTKRQLIVLDNGAMIVDTPGMRELGNFSIEAGMNETFKEIAYFSSYCKYNDCSHTHEKGCEVLAAVERGEISKERYQNYLKINKEAAYNEMSYVEKRMKDKKFGKLCKTVMKYKIKK